MAGELDLGFSRRFARWLPDQSADLLHVHSRRGADIWGGLAARRAGLPAVLTRRVDSADPPVLGRLRYRLYRRVVAISKQVRRQIIAQGVSAENVPLIYSAIDADACVPTWSREQFCEAFELEPDALVAISAAQFIGRKGHAELIRAWAQVAEACPRARLLLFGRGQGEPELKQLAHQHDLAASILFPGFREDLRAFMGCADLLVHPATREGLGVILLEAQAAGLPVVGFARGGVSEAVADGETALLVGHDQPAELSAALLRLLNDAALRARLGAAGQQRARQDFAPEVMAAEYLKVYKDILQGDVSPS
jgi:glycosyltransferase involved in cell wall biosynthesis